MRVRLLRRSAHEIEEEILEGLCDGGFNRSASLSPIDIKVWLVVFQAALYQSLLLTSLERRPTTLLAEIISALCAAIAEMPEPC